jgi:hypothetical protein
MCFVIVLLLLAPVFLCGVNAILNRRPNTHPHRTPFTAGLYTNLVFIPVYVVLHVRIFGSQFTDLICGVVFMLIYINGVVFLNWFIFTLTDVSMHIQLLMQIHRHGSITTADLVERYNKNTILTNRIPRLLELGQLRMTDGLLFVGGRSVLFGAAVCALLRRILGIPVRPEEADHLADHASQ